MGPLCRPKFSSIWRQLHVGRFSVVNLKTKSEKSPRQIRAQENILSG